MSHNEDFCTSSGRQQASYKPYPLPQLWRKV